MAHDASYPTLVTVKLVILRDGLLKRASYNTEKSLVSRPQHCLKEGSIEDCYKIGKSLRRFSKTGPWA